MPASLDRSLTGRAARSNPSGRFERRSIETVDDGWYLEPPPGSIATTVEPDRARALICRNDSPDLPFEYSINPYRGCEHGCIYCYARPTHAYLGLSSGIDFESRLFYKERAGPLLEAELASPRYVCKPITVGANTDPYQPVERELRVTRAVLEVLSRARHPVTLITKSALILRDLDLLSELARDGLVGVAISITTLDAATKRSLEPRAASPEARLRVVRELSAAGVQTGVMVAPVIPALTDHELESILEAGAAAGARWATYVLLRLPYEIKNLFREWLQTHFPERAAHVIALIRQMRGGRDNDPCFGSRMRGTGALAELLRARFELACRRFALEASAHRAIATRSDLFHPPTSTAASTSATSPQLDLGL